MALLNLTMVLLGFLYGRLKYDVELFQFRCVQNLFLDQ